MCGCAGFLQSFQGRFSSFGSFWGLDHPKVKFSQRKAVFQLVEAGGVCQFALVNDLQVLKREILPAPRDFDMYVTESDWFEHMVKK